MELQIVEEQLEVTGASFGSPHWNKDEYVTNLDGPLPLLSVVILFEFCNTDPWVWHVLRLSFEE